MRWHQPTMDYVVRRTTQGLTKKDIIRCLKRFVAREIYHALIKVNSSPCQHRPTARPNSLRRLRRDPAPARLWTNRWPWTKSTGRVRMESRPRSRVVVSASGYARTMSRRRAASTTGILLQRRAAGMNLGRITPEPRASEVVAPEQASVDPVGT
jgi:hypothetical protein